MGKHLVLVGGGHAHMVTLANIDHLTGLGHRVTVVGPSDHHYYSGMGPGMLGGTYAAEDIRFSTRHVVTKQGGRFVKAAVTRIDPQNQTVFLNANLTLTYDVLSFNAGSYVTEDIVAEKGADIVAVKPIEHLLAARRRIIELVSRKRIQIGIVGGGPSAAEVSGNVVQLTSKKCGYPPSVSIYSGGRFMARFPEPVRKRVVRRIKKRGIRIFENDYVKEIHPGRIHLSSGQVHRADFVFLAQGIQPSPILNASGLSTGPDGGLRVNKFLQSIQYPNIFGGGDCICFQDQPLDKVGVYAVRENPVLYHNLKAALEGTSMRAFNPGGDYLLIFNLGDGSGVLSKRWLTFGGPVAFLVKDIIDRRFMRRFQSI